MNLSRALSSTMWHISVCGVCLSDTALDATTVEAKWIVIISHFACFLKMLMLNQRKSYCAPGLAGVGQEKEIDLLTDNPLQRYKAYPLQLPRGIGFRNSGIPLRIKLFSVSVGALFLIFSCELSSCCRVRHKNSLFSQKFNFPLIHWKTVKDAQSTPRAQLVSLKCSLI